MSTKLIWYGHSTLGLEVDQYSLLVDPFFKGNPATNVNPDSLKPDFILVTHGHGDHIGDAVSIAKRTGAMVIANFEICEWLDKKGVKTHAQHLGGGFHYPFGYLKLTLALHGSSLPDDSYGGNPAGFLLTTPGGKKIYLAGDTGLFGDMRLIGEEGLDLAVIPIGDNFTMGPDDALRAVKFLQPRQVVPIHYNTFDVIQQNPQVWAASVQEQTQTKVTVLQPGGSLTL